MRRISNLNWQDKSETINSIKIKFSSVFSVLLFGSMELNLFFYRVNRLIVRIPEDTSEKVTVGSESPCKKPRGGQIISRLKKFKKIWRLSKEITPHL